MSIQVGSGRSRKPTKQVEGPKLQPWHIALIVVAVLVVGWQVFGMIRQSANSNGEFVKTDPAVKAAGVAPGSNAPPNSGTSRMFQEKDRE
jgi:hypothetical protein